MRTTLDIDADVPIAAKKPDRVRNGFELLPAGGTTVTVGLVEKLLDDDG